VIRVTLKVRGKQTGRSVPLRRKLSTIAALRIKEGKRRRHTSHGGRGTELSENRKCRGLEQRRRSSRALSDAFIGAALSLSMPEMRIFVRARPNVPLPTPCGGGCLPRLASFEEPSDSISRPLPGLHSKSLAHASVASGLSRATAGLFPAPTPTLASSRFKLCLIFHGSLLQSASDLD